MKEEHEEFKRPITIRPTAAAAGVKSAQFTAKKRSGLRTVSVSNNILALSHELLASHVPIKWIEGSSWGVFSFEMTLGG